MRSCSGPGAAAASYSRRVRAHNRTRTHLPLFGKRIRSALRRNNKTHYNKDSSPCQGLLTHRFRLSIQPRSRVRQLLKISLSPRSLSPSLSLSLCLLSLFIPLSLALSSMQACVLKHRPDVPTRPQQRKTCYKRKAQLQPSGTYRSFSTPPLVITFSFEELIRSERSARQWAQGLDATAVHNCANFNKRRVLEGAPLHVRPDSVQQSSPCRQHVFVHGPVLVVGPTGVERTYVRSESELAQKAYRNEVLLRSGSSGGELQGTRCACATVHVYTALCLA